MAHVTYAYIHTTDAVTQSYTHTWFAAKYADEALTCQSSFKITFCAVLWKQERCPQNCALRSWPVSFTVTTSRISCVTGFHWKKKQTWILNTTTSNCHNTSWCH